MMKFIKLIQTKSKDLAIKEASSNREIGIKIFASILVILSGLILFTDKITDFGITDTHGFRSSKTFIWVLCQSLSPLILAFGSYLKAYRVSYSAPIYFYFIQLYWVFNAKELGLDDVLLHVYALGFTSTSIIVLFSLRVLYQFIKSYQFKINDALLKQTQILKKHIQELVGFALKESKEESKDKMWNVFKGMKDAEQRS